MNNEKWEKIKELFNINREALSEIAFNPNLEIPKRIKKLFEGVEDDQIIDKLEKHVFLAIDNLVNNKITKLLEAVEYDVIKFKDIVGLYRVMAVHTALLHETHFRIISEQLPEIANRQRLTPNNLNTFNEARTFYLSENYLNEQALRMLANADFENLEAEYQLWDKRLEQSAVYKELKNKTSDIQNLLGKYEHLKLLFKNDIDKLAQSRITPLEFKSIALEQTANMAMAKASELSEPIRLFTLKIEGLEGKAEQNKQDITNLRNSAQQQEEGNNTRLQTLESYKTQAETTTQEIRQKITELENKEIPDNIATTEYVDNKFQPLKNEVDSFGFRLNATAGNIDSINDQLRDYETFTENAAVGARQAANALNAIENLRNEVSPKLAKIDENTSNFESFKTEQKQENLNTNSKFQQIKEKITTLEGQTEQNKQDITTIRNSIQQQHEGNNTRFQVLENYNTQAQATTQEIRQKITELEERPIPSVPDNILTADNLKATEREMRNLTITPRTGNTASIFLKGNDRTKWEFFADGGNNKFGIYNKGAESYAFDINNDNSVKIYNNLNANNKKIINLLTPTANNDAATKKYVDDKFAQASNQPANTSNLENVARTTESNIFVGEQIFNSIKLWGSSNEYILQNDNNVLKLKNGANSLLEFNGDNLNGGALKTYIDNKLNTQNNTFESLHIGRSNFEDAVNSTGDYTIDFGAHKRYSGGESFTYKPNLQIKVEAPSTQMWQINSGRSGEDDNRVDIAFNASGLTTSALKTYIDNAVNEVRSSQPSQKDYKVYTSYKKIDLSEGGTWNKNVYSFPRNGGNNLTKSDNILGITINYIFKNNSSRSVSFSSLPSTNKGLAHSVIANDSSGNPHAFYFEIKQYGSNTTWHDFNVVYSGAHKLYDASWTTGNHVKSVEIWINYQK